MVNPLERDRPSPVDPVDGTKDKAFGAIRFFDPDLQQQNLVQAISVSERWSHVEIHSVCEPFLQVDAVTIALI